MEGTRQTILIFNAQPAIAERVYQLIRDSSCHEFNLILVDYKVNLEKILNKNNLSIILFCASVPEVFQEGLKRIDDCGVRVPVLCIIPSAISALTSMLKDRGFPDPMVVSELTECALLQNIFYIIEREKISTEIMTRDAILRSVNFAAESFLNNAEWRSFIREVLQKLAVASRADRVAIFENIKNEDGNITSARLVDYWMKVEDTDIPAGIPGEIYTYTQLGIAQSVKVLTTSRYLQSHVRDLPKKTQSIFHLLKIKSVLIMSVFTNGDWWGFFRFDQCSQERQWKEIEIEALHTAASILSAAITRQKTDARLKHLATHDFLTNLPNRLLFEDHLQSAILRSQRSKKWVGLYVVDLDHFKKVNDVYGHPFGDKVLIEVGKRLQESIRASDTVARIGGDEFIVLGEELTSLEDLKRVADKILSAFVEPILCDNNNIQVYPSIGVSVYPINGVGREELMRFADVALYRAKKQGNTFSISENDPEKQLWLDDLQNYGS